tara:strand:+ start:2007 stop:2120 length:114 start_codon:yes stop_codon:yes gene_type:complete
MDGRGNQGRGKDAIILDILVTHTSTKADLAQAILNKK